MQYTTPHTLDFLKRKARILAKKSGIQHSKALDKVVQDEGFENWRHYLNSTKQSSTHPAVSTEANIQSLINTPIPYPYIKTTPTEASTLLEAAKKVIPNLTHFGIGIHAEAKARKELGSKAVDAQTAEGQTTLGQRLEEIAIAADWLKLTVRTKSINRGHSSYGYKHMVESWCRGRNAAGETVPKYVANGSFIAAAAGLGHKFDVTGPNAYFNISERFLPDETSRRTFSPIGGPLVFTDWLMRHRNRDSPLGDLANDAASDRSWPVDASTLEEYRSHLYSKSACSEAVETLEQAWKTYRSFLKRGALSKPIEHSAELQQPTAQ